MKSTLTGSFATALLFTAFALPAAASTPSDAWIQDYDVALKMAREQKKDLLLDFTGSDWCGWCKRLDSEVFDTELFLQGATKHFILVKLDFPRGEEAIAKVPNPERNAELNKRYGIRGYPSILLLTSDETKYGQTGYVAGGPEKYLEHLKKLREPSQEARTIAREFKKRMAAAEGERTDQIAILGEVIGVLEGFPAEHAGHPFLRTLGRRAFELDEGNTLGLRLRATKVLLVGGDKDKAVLGAAEKLDPSNAHGALEQAIRTRVTLVRDEDGARSACAAIQTLMEKESFKDDATAAFLLLNAAVWNHKFFGDLPLAKRFARAAVPYIGDDQRMKDRIDSIIDA